MDMEIMIKQIEIKVGQGLSDNKLNMDMWNTIKRVEIKFGQTKSKITRSIVGKNVGSEDNQPYSSKVKCQSWSWIQIRHIT